MKIVATVEVRMGSSRLPGKALMDLQGKPVLERVVERIRRSRHIQDVVIATTVNPKDDALAEWANKYGVRCYRGSEEDVLDRVCRAAREAGAGLTVQFGGDSPFLDWEVADAAVDRYLSGPDCDLVSNCLKLTYPLGVYAYVVPFHVMEEVDRSARAVNQREDVTRYIWENPGRYRLVNLEAPPELRRPQYRLTLDYPEDLELTRRVYAALGPANPAFTTGDVIRWLDAHPETAKLNRDCVQRSAPHLGS